MSKLWRRWQRHQSPAGRILRWTPVQSGLVLMLCIAAATASSLPWLLEPDLQPGDLAPFDARAPRAAQVRDSTALEQRRSTLVARSVVQVIDPDQTDELMGRLGNSLPSCSRSRKADPARGWSGEPDPAEQDWLEQRSDAQQLAWENQVRRAATRMLSQGLVSSLAVNQLQQASTIQPEPFAMHRNQPDPGGESACKQPSGQQQPEN